MTSTASAGRARFVAACLALACLTGCARPPAGFAHEIDLGLDGSGVVTVSGEPWMWTSFKRVGDAADPERTVTDGAVRSLFESSGLAVRSLRRGAREGRPVLTVSAAFDSLDSITGTAAFPDLVIRSVREGHRTRIFGVWRRPQRPAGSAAQGPSDDVVLRISVRGRVFEARGAVPSAGGLAWTLPLSRAIAGDAIDFGAAVGQESVWDGWIRAAVVAISAALVALAAVLFFAWRRSPPSGSRRRRGGGDGSPESDFSKYDPTSPS